MLIFGNNLCMLRGWSIASVSRTIYSMRTSTVMFDAYVKLRTFASIGIIVLVAPLFSYMSGGYIFKFSNVILISSVYASCFAT